MLTATSVPVALLRPVKNDHGSMAVAMVVLSHGVKNHNTSLATPCLRHAVGFLEAYASYSPVLSISSHRLFCPMTCPSAYLSTEVNVGKHLRIRGVSPTFFGNTVA